MTSHRLLTLPLITSESFPTFNGRLLVGWKLFCRARVLLTGQSLFGPDNKTF